MVVQRLHSLCQLCKVNNDNENEKQAEKVKNEETTYIDEGMQWWVVLVFLTLFKQQHRLAIACSFVLIWDAKSLFFFGRQMETNLQANQRWIRGMMY